MDNDREERIFRMVRDAQILDAAGLETLRQAVERCRQRHRAFTVAELLVSEGLLSKYQVQSFMENEAYYEARSEDRFYGRVAVKNRLIEEEDFTAYRRRQKSLFLKRKEVHRLGHLLLQDGKIDAAQHAAILRAIYKVKPEFSLVRSFVEEAARLAGSSLKRPSRRLPASLESPRAPVAEKQRMA